MLTKIVRDWFTTSYLMRHFTSYFIKSMPYSEIKLLNSH